MTKIKRTRNNLVAVSHFERWVEYKAKSTEIFPNQICIYDKEKRQKAEKQKRGFIGVQASPGRTRALKCEGIMPTMAHHGITGLESISDLVTWHTQCRYGGFPCSTGNAITSATS